MNNIDGRSFSELMSELMALANEVVSLSKESGTKKETSTQFTLLVGKLCPFLDELGGNNKFMERSTIRKAVESLETELKLSAALIQSPNPTSVKRVEEIIDNLGRSLGLLLFASLELSTDFKDKIGELQKDLMSARFSPISSPTSSRESELVSELKVESEIIEERITLDIGDVALQLKYGNDEEFKFAVWGLNELIGSGNVSHEMISEEGIIPILFNRLGSSKLDNRSTLIQLLRRLALESADNKVYIIICEITGFLFP